MPDLTLVHLVSASYDAGPVARFARAYRAVEAGCPHRLVILMNGFGRVDDGAHRAALEGIDHEVMEVPRTTIDLNSYIHAARRLPPGPLCFLNSHSEPLVDGWLERLDAAIRRPGVGLAGATGSWESTRSLNPFSGWPRYPNAHLRTNAFVIDRDLMTSLHWPDVSDKRQAWQLESGRRSITRQTRARGYRVVVVGRDGAYEPAQWPHSGTFRAGNQANLLVADNRTREWADADPARRNMLTLRAWGRP